MNEQSIRKPNLLALFSAVFGVAALVSVCTGMAYVFGGMGICFALLSRRPKMESKAIIGMTLSVIACVFMTIILSISVYMLTSSGLWAKFQARAESVDFTNEREVLEFRDEITEDIFEYYQSLTPSIYGNAESEQTYIPDDPVDDDNGEYAI